MKTVNDWVKLATSNDETRFNLTKVYRDKTALVATDGHRLHLVSNLPEQTPMFLDGTTEEFPNYKQVIRNCNKVTHTIDINPVLKEFQNHLQDLKRVVALVKPYDKTKSAKLTIDHDKITLSLKTTYFFISLDLTATALWVLPENTQSKLEIGVNLSYLIDALSIGITQTAYPIRIEFNRDLGPIRFSSENTTAIIMPMRLV